MSDNSTSSPSWVDIEGLTYCHVDDPFGNRIELVQVDGDGTN
ncbi:VOC family protein [Ilumatobacter sp.]